MKPHAKRLSFFVVALLTLVCIFTVVFDNNDADSSSAHTPGSSLSPVAVGDGKKSDKPSVDVVEDHHVGAATLEESAYARSGAASTMDDSRNKLEREAHKQGVSKLLSATTANAAERSSSLPTTEQRSANNPRIHFFLQRFPLIFFNLTKWMFPSSSWGFRETQQHGFPLSDSSSSTSAVEPSSFFGELKKDGANNHVMSARITVMSPNLESHVGDKTTAIKKKEYKVVCADTMQPTLMNITSSNKQRTAVSTLFEKEFTKFIGAATITKSQNGFLGENVCVPLWGFIHGFSSRSKDGKSGGGAKKGKESLKKRADNLQLKMQTEMRTTVKDFMFSSWQSSFFSDAGGGGGKRSSNSEEDRDEEEQPGSMYCAMREELQENAERSSSSRSVVVIHPVRQHFNNVYHIVLRLAATLSFMKRRAHAAAPTTLQEGEANNSTTIQQETRSSSSAVAQQLQDFIDGMSSAARHSYYSERGLISCEEQVHGLPPRLREFKCSDGYTSSSSENCGVKMAFVLTRPAVTTDPDVAYSAKRNIYRKLFQAIAPRRCVTRTNAASQKALRSKSRPAIVDDDEPWFSTVGIPRSPLPPLSTSSVARGGKQDSSTQKEDVTQDGFRFRNATSKFEVEVGADLAKGIQRHQYSEQPKQEREAPSSSSSSSSARGFSSYTSSSLSLSPFSAMCFDDAIIGWDKFPMMGPFSDDMKVAFRTYRRALLAYYYPHNYFKATIDKRKLQEEAALRKESIKMVSPLVIPTATPRLQTHQHLDDDRVFFDALPASLFPQCATTQEEKDPASSLFVVHVLVIIRKDNRRILNHDVVMETLKAQGTFFFPLPKSYQSVERNAHSSSSSVQAGVCAKLEIKIIEPEVLSMAEQIKAAAEADIVMAVNGAALTLASFQKLCYPHCVWIEINPPTKAYAGWSGWNNNPKGVFGALMTLGGIGHHLAWKQPLHTRCHVVYKKQMNITEGERKANTTGAVGGTTYDEDCVTLTRKDTPRSLHEYPPGMFRKQRDVPPPPSLTIRFDIKVNTTDMLTTMRSAVCLNVVRGRWATKWVLNPNGTTDINNHQEEALEGDDDSERTEKRKQLSMAMKPQLDALCDVVVP